ncbi:hypothetical protein A3206_06010 [Candidatus Methanomassiliicoccus intestinalis]|nr:MAG: hypothetical protein A3206_06010 [Candidatus Methanomassiliicoccus intestinalis]
MFGYHYPAILRKSIKYKLGKMLDILNNFKIISWHIYPMFESNLRHLFYDILLDISLILSKQPRLD